jgi:exonuclease VII small subunit
MNDDLSQIIERLRSISDELADRALDELKEAHRSGATRRPEAEKTLSQARRSVEKAIALLSRADSGD